MTILSDTRYIVETLHTDNFCVIDRVTGAVMKALSDFITATEWADYFNDLDKQDMWRKS